MFGRNADSQQLEFINRRLATLEKTVSAQQHLIDMLLTETGLELSNIPTSLLPSQGILHPEVVELLREDKYIAAIKRHRELTGMGLAEAKHLIDAEKPKYVN